MTYNISEVIKVMAKLNLDSIIKNKKISQQQLSDETGINKSTINRYCTNSFEKLDMAHLDILCEHLDITPNELFEIESGAIFDDLSLPEVLDLHYGSTLNNKFTVMKNYLNYLNDKLHNFTNQQKIILSNIEQITHKIKEVTNEITKLKQQPLNIDETATQILLYLKFDIAEKRYHNDFDKLYLDIISDKNTQYNYEDFKNSFKQLIIEGYINNNTLIFVRNFSTSNLHPYLKLYFEKFYNMFIEEYWVNFSTKKD